MTCSLGRSLRLIEAEGATRTDAETAAQAHAHAPRGKSGAPPGSWRGKPRGSNAQKTRPSFETVPLGLKTLQWHGGDDDADDSTVI